MNSQIHNSIIMGTSSLPSGYSSVSLSLTLAKNEKFEQYIKKKYP